MDFEIARPRSWATSVLAATLLVACASKQPASDPGGAPRLSWADAEPELVLPATTASDQVNFGRATGAARLSNGELAVLDAGGPGIKIFSRNGTLVREFGRSGDGPGEFRGLRWMSDCGSDSLFVYDLVQKRMSVFSPEGVFLRQFPVQTSVLGIACDGAGRVVTLAMAEHVSMPSATVPLDSSGLSLQGQDVTSGRLARVPIGWNRPLGQMTWVAMSSAGIVLARGDSALVEFRDLDGTVVNRVPLGQVGPAPTPDAYSAEIERLLLLYFVDPEDRVRPREVLMNIPPPEFVSACRGIVADSSGAVWVTTSPRGAGETVLEGAMPNGTLIGSLRFPGELEILAVGMDYVLGLEEWPDGSQRILVFALDRTRSK